MPDKIEKTLAKLSPKERAMIEAIIRRLHINELEGLDVKQIVGHRGFYRVRKGRVRIIFIATENGNRVFSVSNRDDKTYRDFN
jgi:mRNA-degrading endonuclease RelE of RelBE toxin-antitoxin system